MALQTDLDIEHPTNMQPAPTQLDSSTSPTPTQPVCSTAMCTDTDATMTNTANNCTATNTGCNGSGGGSSTPAATVAGNSRKLADKRKSSNVIANRRVTTWLKSQPLSDSRKSLLFGVVVDNRQLKLITHGVLSWGVITLIVSITALILISWVSSTFNYAGNRFVGKLPDYESLPGSVKSVLESSHAVEAPMQSLGASSSLMNAAIFFTILIPFVGLGIFSAAVFAVRSAIQRRCAKSTRMALVAICVCLSVFVVMFLFAVSSYASVHKATDAASNSISEYANAIALGGGVGMTLDNTNRHTLANPAMQLDLLNVSGSAAFAFLHLFCASLVLIVTSGFTLWSTLSLHKSLTSNLLPHSVSGI
eukprot:GHVQ01025461.1.p1 GENE.GHVQ01025461.1~~GHVQ01025461.1.p1  ORF type:complete len:363 (+),score=55.25 GHVQ01025461.1:345-1433(+)